jgi:hypothetical protein
MGLAWICDFVQKSLHEHAFGLRPLSSRDARVNDLRNAVADGGLR